MEQTNKTTLDLAIENLAAMSIEASAPSTKFFINDAYPSKEEQTKFFLRSVKLYISTVGANRNFKNVLCAIAAAYKELAIDNKTDLVQTFGKVMDCVFDTAITMGRFTATLNGNIDKYTPANDESEEYYRGLVIRSAEALLDGDMESMANEALGITPEMEMDTEKLSEKIKQLDSALDRAAEILTKELGIELP